MMSRLSLHTARAQCKWTKVVKLSPRGGRVTYEDPNIVVEIRREGALWQDHPELVEAIRRLQFRVEH